MVENSPIGALKLLLSKEMVEEKCKYTNLEGRIESGN